MLLSLVSMLDTVKVWQVTKILGAMLCSMWLNAFLSFYLGLVGKIESKDRAQWKIKDAFVCFDQDKMLKISVTC